ncbi:MAG TPA: hypothetical protein VEV83_18700 [Parafilimonas sp.]|nr:hypothetical protein [Parafilimonas sp.]
MKIKIVIGGKIPDKYTNNGEELCQIEINAQFIIEKKNEQVVQAEADNGEEHKSLKIRSCVTTRCVKRPLQVPKEIVYDRDRKAEAVCNIFIEAKFFFAKPRNKKIHAHPKKTDNAKLENFFHKLHVAK